ncbi:hypothetical protein [Oscillibacter sp.]|uniref:hypothetical protein n=1 Tax=Oscillibacter sp. TaxID=1945593 RepID=UPI002898C8DE|nr:hypothetical protein [Oscillibacter sp.]
MCGCRKLQFNQRKAITDAAKFFASTPLRFAWFLTAACLFNWQNEGNQKTFSKQTFGPVLLEEAGFRQRRDAYFCQKACNSKKNAQKAVRFDAQKQLFFIPSSLYKAGFHKN